MSEEAPHRHLRVVCEDARQGAPTASAHKRPRRPRARDVRAMTIAMNRLSKSELSLGRALFPVEEHIPRPQTRAECAVGERPCPFVSCKYHLYLDVEPRTGGITLNFPDLEVWEMTESCALDVADAGGVTLEEAGDLINVTRERIRQIAGKAFSLLAKKAPDLAEAALDEPQERESQLASIMSPNGGAGTSDDDDDRTADGDWKPRPKNLFADEGTDEGDAAFVGALYDRALRDRCALESGERRVWNGHYLSPRHGAVLDVLPGFFEAHGRGPTFRELAQLLDPDGAADHSSVVAVRSRCLTLREIGAVEWSRGSGVVMRRVVSEVVDGSVSQGGPESSTAGEKQERGTMPSKTTISEKQQAILDAYNRNPSPGAVAEECGTTSACVSVTISRLRKMGLVTQPPKQGPKGDGPRGLSARKEAILSAFNEGLGFDEIAERVGCSVNAARTAVKILRKRGLAPRGPREPSSSASAHVSATKAVADGIERGLGIAVAQKAADLLAKDGDPLVASLRGRLANIDEERARLNAKASAIVAAIEALGGAA